MPVLTLAPPMTPHPNMEAVAMTRATRTDDDLLALLYIGIWALRTGRTLRDDVPAAQLTEEELIDFWADDQITADEALVQRRPR
jgi:hypothetical protein